MFVVFVGVRPVHTPCRSGQWPRKRRFSRHRLKLLSNIPPPTRTQTPYGIPATMGSCVCTSQRTALRNVEQTSSAASWKSPTPAQRWTPYPFPHSVQNGRRHSSCTLIPATDDLAGHIHKITGKFDLVSAGDAKPWKAISESTVNAALRTMGYDTKVDICATAFAPWRVAP